MDKMKVAQMAVKLVDSMDNSWADLLVDWMDECLVASWVAD
jgi:hypothetical protein